MKFSYLYGSVGTPVRYSLEPYKRRTKTIAVAVFSLLIIFSAVTTQMLVRSKDAPVARAIPDSSVSAEQDRADDQPKPASLTDSNVAVSEAISKWVSSHSGTYGVVVSDTDGNVLGESNAQEPFFMASIYKLYVAYLGYQKVDDGSWSADEPFLSGWSRGKCLDEMIRSSDSPCAEKLLKELGKDTVTDRLKGYGLTSTSMRSLTTSAADANKILVKIEAGIDLTESSKQKILDSMANQKYRSAMPKGFQGATVYDKVGFREETEYHDVGIVRLQDGRKVVVSILTEKVGVTNIESLSRQISSAIR
jgi:beta-lactamase class A